MARQRALVISFSILIGLCWIGAGQTNPLPRNPAGDAVAERFARSGQVDASEADTLDATLDADGQPRDRMNFVPRFAVLFGVPQSNPDRSAPVSGQASAPVPGEEGLITDDLAVVLIRKLPAGSLLSAGTRLSATAWALSRADLRDVVVTLPPGRHGPIRAEIAVYGRAGSPSGTMTVEIRESRRVQPAKPRRGHLSRTATAATPKHAAQPKHPVPGPKQAAPQMPPAASSTAAAANSKTPSALQASSLPPLLFLPGPITTPAPPARDTAGHQILLNLGVPPRDAPAAIGLQGLGAQGLGLQQ